jgi:hypothetical protein
MSDVTTDVDTVVDNYFAMWNEEDAAARAQHIARAWAVDGQYLDPLLEADGHGALSDMVATVHAHYPGQRFERMSGIDKHHDELRFAWRLFAPDGTTTVAGLDIGHLAPDGRLQRITGFFGELPE